MRERLTGSLIIGYILIMIAFSFLTLSNAHGQIQKKAAAQLPSFTYYTLDGKKFTNHDLKNNSKLMIVYFNPVCDVCQKETEEIVHNMSYFKDIQIVMISPSTKDEIVKFTQHYNLSSYPQITVLHDPEDAFYKQFNAMGYPTLFMYDEKKNFLAQINSHAGIEEIQEVFGPSVVKR